MKFEKHIYQNVKEDGTFENEAGAVVTKGRISMSINGRCGLSGCHCSDGYWIFISLPRTINGTVETVTVHFDNEEELNKFLKNKTLEN